MRKHKFFWVVCMILAFQVAALTSAQAEAVGRLTQVEGRVDILRGGQLPATPVKVGDEVQPGDVLRSKSLSKAQINFIDNSTITISPESRLAIEAYMFDSAQNKRNAVIKLFQGLAHIVVNKVFKAAKPEFIIKTQTAIVGVRGTDFGIRINPNSADILNFQGLLQVGNIFPEVGQLSRQASKVAYSFGPGGGGAGHWVYLKDMQGTSVARNLPPTKPYELTRQDREMFMRQLSAIVPAGPKFSQDQTTVSEAASSTKGLLSSIVPVSANTPGEQSTLTLLNTITVPPLVVPQQEVEQVQTQTTPASGIAIPVFNILMSWGAGAWDLDLHLTGPEGEGTFHVYYGNPGSLTEQPFAMLQRDDTGYSGSEVITVQSFNLGELYQAYVFNYGNPDPTSTNLSTTSGVSLQVINGGDVVPTSGGTTVTGGTLVITLVPTPGQEGNTWDAITIDPATGQVIVVNQITDPPIEAKSSTEAATVAVTSVTTVAPTPSAPTTPAVATTAAATTDATLATSPGAPTTPVAAMTHAVGSTATATTDATLATSSRAPTTPVAAMTPAVAMSTAVPTTAAVAATTARPRILRRARIPSRIGTPTGSRIFARPMTLTGASIHAGPLALAGAATPARPAAPAVAATTARPRILRRARIPARTATPAVTASPPAAMTSAGAATPGGAPR